jgi:hypothetical protein
VADSSIGLDELVDLKMLPAWANEPAPAERYAHVDAEDEHRDQRRDRHRDDRRPGGKHGTGFKPESRTAKRGERGHQPSRDRRSAPVKPRPKFGEFRSSERERGDAAPKQVVPKVDIRFFPRAIVVENVVTQIKENSVAYSLFALARLFLAKPERYEVQLTASAESPLYQLGEHGAVSADREFLERSAFRLAQPDFYKVDITESEPIKGNFTAVARDRLSGTILGPTNHHDYQKRLRGLYEQRFSRRMSFADYQRQIEIVSDPQLVEQWKEDARKITTYSTLNEEPPVTFASAAEAQRHFRDTYLPSLVRPVTEVLIDGAISRHLQDRVLYRLIENEWSRENASPSRMMPELATQFRQAGLQVFRHRRGMLFVSAVRPRPLVVEETAVSAAVRSIMEALAAQPRINRKDLAAKILANVAAEDAESAKLSLAADLHWLVREGHVLEFNDGSLDLPRVKKQPQDRVEAPAVMAEENSAEPAPSAAATTNSPETAADKQTDGTEFRPVEHGVAPVVATAEPKEQALSPASASTPAEAEIGGS